MPDFSGARGEARPDFDEANFLAALVETLGAPPDRPLLPIAVQTLKLALDAAAVSRFGGRVYTIVRQVDHLSSKLTRGPRDLPLLMAGRASLYPVWSAFASIEIRKSNAALRLIGGEFLLSFLEGRRFRESIVSMAHSLPADLVAVTRSHYRYIAQIEVAVAKVATAANSGTPQAELLLNRRVAVAMAVQKQTRDNVLRTCVGGRRALPPERAREVGHAIHQGISEGNLSALAVSVCFLLGLPVEVGLDVRFVRAAGADYLAAIDPDAGYVVMRMRELLHDLARNGTNSQERQFELRRPLPTLHAKLLLSAYARNPGATCFRDLLGEDAQLIAPGIADRMTSVASFLNSRGAVAVAAGVDRHVAVYAVGALGLIGNARFHYLEVSQEEIQEACCKVYQWIGWGEAVSVGINTGSVGSRVMSSSDSIRQIDHFHRSRTESLRVGRRTKIESLLRFHNAYAVLCTSRAALFCMARAARSYAFNAASWSADIPYGTLRDKAAGPWAGETPLPIPTVLAAQIEYWRSHLAALDKRLAVFGWSNHTPARENIAAVLQCAEAPLFFTVSSTDSLEIPGSSEVFKHASEVKHDAFRHYLSNELRRVGVPGQFIDAASRHTVPHSSVSSITSCASTYQWLSQCAAALDEIAQKLGIFPMPGLGRSKR